MRSLLILLMTLIALMVLIPSSLACANISTSLVEGRYRDSDLSGLNLTCAGAAPASCYYSINDFANTTISNCSNFSINSELGWNRINMCVSNGTSGNCTSLNFWAKKLSGGTSSDYAVMIVTLIISIMLFLLGGFLAARIFWFLAGVGGLVLGYEMIAFSMFAGVSVVICSALFSLAIMFRRGE